MKSPYRIAKEIGVSPQAVYQKIDRLNSELNSKLNSCIQRKGKKILIDEVGENLIKSAFSIFVDQSVDQSVEQTVDQPSGEHDEIAFLRKHIEELTEELIIERTHSRKQAENLSQLSEQLVELTRNSQILFKQEQDRNKLLPEASVTADGISRRRFWNIFRKDR